MNRRFNKRKLNEFIFIIEKLKDENLRFEMMKDHLYKQTNTENYFDVYQNYAFDEWPYECDKKTPFLLGQDQICLFCGLFYDYFSTSFSI
jgi:hypothetical protein